MKKLKDFKSDITRVTLGHTISQIRSDLNKAERELSIIKKDLKGYYVNCKWNLFWVYK